MIKCFYFACIIFLLVGCNNVPERTDSIVLSDSTFMLFRDGEEQPYSDFETVMKNYHVSRVGISAFQTQSQYDTMMQRCAESNIHVDFYYEGNNTARPWIRRNILSLFDLPPIRRTEQSTFINVFFIDSTRYNNEYKKGEALHVKYITIHNTAEPFNALEERERMSRRCDGKKVSFHFAVDEAGAIQLLPLTCQAFHAGDGKGSGNCESIGIEICRSACQTGKLYSESEDNAARLTALLLQRYKLPISAVKMHKDWSGKHCPHRLLDEDRWESFLERIKYYIKD